MSAALRLASDSDEDLTDSTAATIPASFSDLLLPQALRRAVKDLGFNEPTAIQAAAIPALLAGSDVTGVAQTGTGKTAAFGLPLLAAIDPDAREVQALVLAPTRELAMQVAKAIESFAVHLPTVSVATVYGGAPYGKQLSQLRGGAQIVVGTPGRIIDHIERGTLKLGAVRFAVLDEADEMLRMGFAEDVDKILSNAPDQRQTALFSATMPGAIRKVARRHLTKPVDVSVAASARPVLAISQYYALVPFRHKPLALQRVLAMSSAEAAIVFVRTRQGCEELGASLQHAGFRVAVISGDVVQAERERTIARLRAGTIDVLVATDVAARGLDVERIGLVVNYDPPQDAEIYTHRIGRTGRAGRGGDSVLLLTPKEAFRHKKLAAATGSPLAEMTVPTASAVAQSQAHSTVTDALRRLEKSSIDEYRDMLVMAARTQDVSPVDVAAALLATSVGDSGQAGDDPFSSPIRPDSGGSGRSGRKRNPSQGGGDRDRTSTWKPRGRSNGRDSATDRSDYKGGKKRYGKASSQSDNKSRHGGQRSDDGSFASRRQDRPAKKSGNPKSRSANSSANHGAGRKAARRSY